jgi:hypothetical protein
MDPPLDVLGVQTRSEASAAFPEIVAYVLLDALEKIQAGRVSVATLAGIARKTDNDSTLH